MIPIFEGQPPQNKAFSNQKKGHSGLGRYTYSLSIPWEPNITCLRYKSN